MKHWKIFAAISAGLLAALVVGGIPDVSAAFVPLPDVDGIGVPNPEGDTAIQRAESLLGPIGRTLRIVIGAIAVLLIVISGFTMVIGGENEETVKTQKTSITMAIIGLAMISIAGPMAEIFDFRQGNFLEDPDALVERAKLFDDTTKIIVTFFKYVLGSLAALMFIRAGATMISGSHNEEAVTQSKKSLMVGAAGLFLVLISDLVVRNILYDAEYNDTASKTIVEIDQNAFIAQVVAFTNILVTFVGPIMMLGIVIGGVVYVTSAGNEERTNLAKKILLNSVIGIIIIYSAFALVSTVITGSF
ncbi:hypothetical protein HOD30_00360 [Candidatus Peregrinibacteria bacterium]|nr:hypothetical protein [Candidatus Peregrinibacteria bacterium]MBT4632005.1 hypothetical protein [Candidatus Peregrinibacteria bacterium]MBT5516712.1 hypothetical protein [Candidatus Peregrinibacteria bacterium]MBT5823792.1 hypothetical protein [Candidatus Peregrinibacteria bacterium]